MEQGQIINASRDQLNRVLAFFPRVDAKMSVVLAVDTGMLAFLAAKIPSLTSLLPWEIAVALLPVALICGSLWHLYKGAFPSLEGGALSLIYFREIAKRTEAKFIDEFIKQSEEEYLKDMLGQVWRNSEILKEKFDHLKYAFILLALAILPWVVALIIFSSKGAMLNSVALS